MEKLLRTIKRFIPRRLFAALAPYYHLSLSCIGAIIYRFPAREMVVIGVTGTKGKSSTLEYINTILEHAGHTTALISTIRIKIADRSMPNTMRMTMPGRTYIQRTLRKARQKGCTHALIEMTSEGARQKRDRLLFMDALVFTNLSPEHIESHGSMDAYANAKLSIATRLMHSGKRPRTIVANKDDAYGPRFLAAVVEQQRSFSLNETPHEASEKNGWFEYKGERIAINFPGEFSLKNALAAATLADALGIAPEVIKEALANLHTIPGRAENVAGDDAFPVVIDYAHTPDSLEALYQSYPDRRKICVLGATGGGRDHWKRPLMGKIAEQYCAEIILTNEDPYDENPEAIVQQVREGMKKEPTIIMDRRTAIRSALSLAQEGDAVLITGKGTDPSICGPNGAQIPWSDAQVAREELAALRKAA